MHLSYATIQVNNNASDAVYNDKTCTLDNCTVSAYATAISNSGELTITGTKQVMSSTGRGIYSTGTLTIGNSSNPGYGPTILGGSSNYGVYNKAGGTANWYGGTIRGYKNPPYYGTINSIASGYGISTTKDSNYGYYTSTLVK